MGDKYIGQSQFFLQVLQQIHHLDLGMRIQGGDRLIKEDDLWLTGHRPGDAHPLKLAAREFVGKSVRKISRKSHQLQKGGCFFVSLQPSPLPAFPDGQALANDVFDTEAGISRGCVVLKHHTELVLQVPSARPGGVDRHTVQNRLPAVWLQEPTQHPAHSGFSAAGLSQNTEAGPSFYVQGHIKEHLLTGMSEHLVLTLTSETDADIFQFKHRRAPFLPVPGCTGASHPSASPPAAWYRNRSRDGEYDGNPLDPPQAPD